MTCSICKSIKNNKRSCPSRPEATSATRTTASTGNTGVTTEYNATQQSSTGSTRKRSVDNQQESTSKGGESRASRTRFAMQQISYHTYNDKFRRSYR
ncbi:uncharacterized protein LOC107793926 isoform X4 [Nicotiana tabacum]